MREQPFNGFARNKFRRTDARENPALSVSLRAYLLIIDFF
jgi:hypothetical protein